MKKVSLLLCLTLAFLSVSAQETYDKKAVFKNNGFWDNGDNMKLGRVLKSEIGNLDSADWEFYRGGDGMEDSSWSKYIHDAVNQKAGYILQAHRKCSMTGAHYIEALDRYIMIQWHYTSGSGCGNEKALKLGLENAGQESVWDFYESPYPWGPWVKFDSHVFNPLGAYNPCIVPKFSSADGKKFTVFTNGNFQSGDAKEEELHYRLNAIECELEFE